MFAVSARCYRFILDICEGNKSRNIVARVFQVTLKDVFEEEGAVVSYVGTLICRWPTSVHFNLHAFVWLERFNFSREGIK